MTHLTNNALFTKLNIVFSSFAKTIHETCAYHSSSVRSFLPRVYERASHTYLSMYQCWSSTFLHSFGIRVWSSIARWRYKTFKLTIRSSIKRISFLFEFEVVTYNRNRIHFYPITNYLKQWVRRLFVSSHVREVFDVWKMSIN